MPNKARNTGKASKDEAPTQENEPVKKKDDGVRAIVWGFFISLFLTILPINLIVRGLVSIALFLARPILLFLGILKVWEEVERRRK